VTECRNTESPALAYRSPVVRAEGDSGPRGWAVRRSPVVRRDDDLSPAAPAAAAAVDDASRALRAVTVAAV